MVGFRKDRVLLVLIGLSFTFVSTVGDRTARYKGEKEVFEGDRFEVSCVLSSGDYEGWTLNSSITITEDNDMGYVLSERVLDKLRKELTLQVKSAQLYHEGEYRCNRFSRDYHYIHVIPLEGIPPNENSLLQTSNDYILEVNQTYDFYCTSGEDDENTPITWFKNNYRIMENPGSNIYTEGRSLIIENAQVHDAGEYMCAVDLFVKGTLPDIGRIFCLKSPPKILDFSERVSIIQGRSLTLHCKVLGFPFPKVTWYIGNLLVSRLMEEDLRISINSLDGGARNSYLTVRDMHLFDRGLYTCRAENSIDNGLTTSFDEESVFVHVRGNVVVEFV